MASDIAALAELFFRAVGDCDVEVIESLAGDDIVVSYPIYTTLFGTPVIRGRDRYVDHLTGFATRWVDRETTIHRTIAGDSAVALTWSYTATWAGPPSGAMVPGAESSWGGITILEFDDSGRVVAEIGEESVPGPEARIGALGP